MPFTLVLKLVKLIRLNQKYIFLLCLSKPSLQITWFLAFERISGGIFCKGQLISKCIFGIFNSPKRRTRKFDFTATVPQVKNGFVHFLGEFKAQKRHFEIN